jgi:hypothetical protein
MGRAAQRQIERKLSTFPGYPRWDGRDCGVNGGFLVESAGAPPNFVEQTDNLTDGKEHQSDDKPV